jgi:hypothetical protein
MSNAVYWSVFYRYLYRYLKRKLIKKYQIFSIGKRKFFNNLSLVEICHQIENLKLNFDWMNTINCYDNRIKIE